MRSTDIVNKMKMDIKYYENIPDIDDLTDDQFEELVNNGNIFMNDNILGRRKGYGIEFNVEYYCKDDIPVNWNPYDSNAIERFIILKREMEIEKIIK